LTAVIDENGVYYRIPIACINEPIAYNKNEELQLLKNKSVANETKLNVIISYVIICLEFEN
jgi:hypothetical protein